jgi:hypothetical protein
MPTHLGVDELTREIKALSKTNRQKLLLNLAELDEFIEDLEDIADIIHSKEEPVRAYNDFVEELKKEGRL